MDTNNLVILAQSGNNKAFITLIEHNKKTMFKIAKSMMKNDEDAADAIQNTILKTFKSIKTLKEPRYFKTWMIRILINDCNSLLRKKGKEVSIEEIYETGENCNELDRVEIQYVIDKLKPDVRTVIKLYYINDMSIKEISDITHVPEGTVKSRLHRGRKLLGDFMIREGK